MSFTSLESFDSPFPHFVWRRVLGMSQIQALASWLEQIDAWKLIETDFYEQYEFSFLDVNLPSELSFLTSPGFLQRIRDPFRTLLGAALSNRVELCAHKLIPGQTIRVHNDFIPQGATHRLLFQLSEPSVLEDGGLLLFFNSDDSADVAKVFRPIANSAIGFGVSHTSYHAVSTQHRDDRFTLVATFRES